MKKLMLSVFALAAFGFSANAQNAVGSAAVALESAISVSSTGGDYATGIGEGALNFGKIAIGSISTDFVVSTGGLMSKAGLGDAQIIDFADVTAAGFKVMGAEDATFVVAVDEPTITLSDGKTTIGTFVTTLDGTNGTIASGVAYFAVGATLTVPTDASVGALTGVFNVTVNYN